MSYLAVSYRYLRRLIRPRSYYTYRGGPHEFSIREVRPRRLPEGIIVMNIYQYVYTVLYKLY